MHDKDPKAPKVPPNKPYTDLSKPRSSTVKNVDNPFAEPSKVPPIPITETTHPDLIRVMSKSEDEDTNPFAKFAKDNEPDLTTGETTEETSATPPTDPVQPDPVPAVTSPPPEPAQVETNENPFLVNGGKAADEDNKAKGNPQTILSDYIDKIEKYMSGTGEPTATVMQNHIKLNFSISSREFKDHLLHHVYSNHNVVPERKEINEAVYFAESLARVSGKTHELHNRMVYDGKQLTLDLVRDDGMYVVADQNGWKVTPEVDHKFVRYPNMSALPIPDSNGNVLELLPFLNIQDVYDKILVVCWVIASFITSIARPIPCISGTQGSAKTTMANMLKGLVDPAIEGGVYLRGKEDEVALMLNQSAMPFFDNLTKINAAVENMLCMGSTGGGFKKRQLYTNDNMLVYRFKRAILMTGINLPYQAQDLMDRTISIELTRIPKGNRKFESDVWREFEAAKPRILGGMLDVLRGAMKRLPTTKVLHPPRMADFALWGSAIADEIGERYGNGWDAVKFQTAYHRAQERGYKSSIAGDKFILALVDFFEAIEKQGRYEVHGKVSECLEGFAQHALALDRNADYIPSTPQLFSQVLKKYVPVLEINGWLTEFSESRKYGRFLTFKKTPPNN
ncbi:hypothetical protein [Pseudodesulfovibrio sp.]|uniref:hypothetical protein n=1 Tax=Pseudodesulfovibrio sp. TaxID=2035812 RepID=UPI002623FA97|nr:hypothetical protein [Pseudodesulfovibrio sp.]MDD3311186.1 hypothetical protein [Pseudodesulfovibrio sp.]